MKTALTTVTALTGAIGSLAASAHEAPVHVHLADGSPLFLGLGIAAAMLVPAGIFFVRRRSERIRRR